MSTSVRLIDAVYWQLNGLKYTKVHADNGEYTHCGREIPCGAIRVFKNVDKTKDTSDFCKKCWDL